MARNPRTMEHLEGYLAADGIDLSSDVLDRIDQIVPPAVRPRPRPPSRLRHNNRAG